jgi:hypothetical protein
VAKKRWDIFPRERNGCQHFPGGCGVDLETCAGMALGGFTVLRMREMAGWRCVTVTTAAEKENFKKTNQLVVKLID